MRILRLALCVVAVGLFATTPAVAGNEDAAKACQQGGWQSLHRADGSGFRNAGDCVSYAARGGKFGAPASCTITAVVGDHPFDPVADYSIACVGLVPGSDVYGTFTYSRPDEPPLVVTFAFSTIDPTLLVAADGTWRLSFSEYCASFSFYVTGTSAAGAVRSATMPECR